jgi:hypothetical protein
VLFCHPFTWRSDKGRSDKEGYTMTRLALALAAALLALPAVAVAQAPAPAGPTPAQQAGRDLPMARLMTDGAQVRGGQAGLVFLQLGKFVFACRYGDGKPALCDQIP